MDEQARTAKYETEIARLDRLYEDLELLWSHVPRYGYVGLLAPVVWYFFGFGWAFVELLVTVSLVATQGYLIKMRLSENRWNRRMVDEDLQRLRAEIAERQAPRAG